MYQLNITILYGGTHSYRFKDHKNAQAIYNRVVQNSDRDVKLEFEDDFGTKGMWMSDHIIGCQFTDFDQSFKSEEALRIMSTRSQMRADARAAQDPEIKQMSLAANNLRQMVMPKPPGIVGAA